MSSLDTSGLRALNTSACEEICNDNSPELWLCFNVWKQTVKKKKSRWIQAKLSLVGKCKLWPETVSLLGTSCAVPWNVRPWSVSTFPLIAWSLGTHKYLLVSCFNYISKCGIISISNPLPQLVSWIFSDQQTEYRYSFYHFGLFLQYYLHIYW